MIVGILSDTHDRVDSAIAGLDLLRNGGAEFFIHCGDIGGEGIIDLFAGLPCALVWGNNDWDRRSLGRYAESVGVRIFETPGELELDARTFAIAHGDDEKAVRQILDRQAHDYLLVGHSHIRADRRIGKIRIINPGALHRAAPRSVALLDTSNDALKFVTL